MIKGFEKETEELSDQEINMLSVLKGVLFAHVGSKKAITSGECIRTMKLNGHIVRDGSRLRKMINSLRRMSMPNLAATSKGYYIETDLRKLKEYSKGLRNRASAVIAVADCVDQHISKQTQENALKSQTDMFTKIG